MSRVESSELSDELMRLLDGGDLDTKVGETILLLTVSNSGWPHLAMLSVGELVAVSPVELRLALWPGSETGDNLKRSGQATLMIVEGGAGHYVEVDVRATGDLVFEDGPLDSFTCTVSKILADVVDYAILTTGIRFKLLKDDEVLGRWRRTVSAMRAS